MAARQVPPSAVRAPAPLERAFERKVWLSKWALLFEQLWPRAWLVLGLGRAVHRRLARRPVAAPPRAAAQDRPRPVRPGASPAALVALARVRWPSREQAIRRVEAISGIKHRPASSYEDTLTLGAEDARTAALWRVHRHASRHCCRSCASAILRRAPTAMTPSRCAPCCCSACSCCWSWSATALRTGCARLSASERWPRARRPASTPG